MSTREIIRVIGKKLVESGLVVIYYEKLSHPAKKKLFAKQKNSQTFQHKVILFKNKIIHEKDIFFQNHFKRQIFIEHRGFGQS